MDLQSSALRRLSCLLTAKLASTPATSQGDPWREVAAQGSNELGEEMPVSSALLHHWPISAILFGRSERSAARLAHQSGGLGVPSSNLGAPTSKIKGLHFSQIASHNRGCEANGKQAINDCR
jgi:hypothetical protein